MSLHCTKDAEGVITDVNDTCVSFFGFNSRADIIGKTAFDILPPSLAQQILAEEQKARANGGGMVIRTVFTSSGWRVINAWIDVNPNGSLSVRGEDVTDAVDPLGVLKLLDMQARKLRTRELFGADLNEIGMACLIGTCLGWAPGRIAESVHRSKKTVEYHLKKIRDRVEEIAPGATIQECVFSTGFSVLLLRQDWFDP